jgi:hypothetical protein
MRLAGRIEWTGRKGMYRGFWWESQKVKNCLEDPDIRERIILE